MMDFTQGLAALAILLALAQPLHSASDMVEKPLSVTSNIDYFGKLLNIKYKLIISDNFDNVLKALGASYTIRLLALVAKPVDSLIRNDRNLYTLTSKWTFLVKFNETFTPGQPFDFVTHDGRHVTAVITAIKPGVLREVQTEKNGRKTIIDRTFTDDQLRMVIKVDDVVSTRIYQAPTPTAKKLRKNKKNKLE